jgi:hypothetical protein
LTSPVDNEQNSTNGPPGTALQPDVGPLLGVQLHESPPQRAKSVLGRIFWLPLACLVAIELYARNFDGWGAWATAPLFLLPFGLSLAIAGAGAHQAFSELRSSAARSSTFLFTAVAAAPIAWLLVRRHFV